DDWEVLDVGEHLVDVRSAATSTVMTPLIVRVDVDASPLRCGLRRRDRPTQAGHPSSSGARPGGTPLPSYHQVQVRLPSCDQAPKASTKANHPSGGGVPRVPPVFAAPTTPLSSSVEFAEKLVGPTDGATSLPVPRTSFPEPAPLPPGRRGVAGVVRSS